MFTSFSFARMGGFAYYKNIPSLCSRDLWSLKVVPTVSSVGCNSGYGTAGFFLFGDQLCFCYNHLFLHLCLCLVMCRGLFFLSGLPSLGKWLVNPAPRGLANSPGPAVNPSGLWGMTDGQAKLGATTPHHDENWPTSWQLEIRTQAPFSFL
jgi:hypothetical protein